MEIHYMKKIFTILTLIAFVSTSQARGSWHHDDWIGLGIGIAAVTALATVSVPQTVRQETVVVQQTPTYVVPAQPTQTIIVERPIQTYVPPVQIVPMPPPPRRPPHYYHPRPLPPPPPPRHAPPPPPHRHERHRR